MVFKNCAILAGTTASGKTEIALEFAREHKGLEIVSADSLAVYLGTDIASAKPSRELRAEIPHHLIDVLEPSAAFSAGEFVRLATAAVKEIRGRGRAALIVGGTGFYLRALLTGTWTDTQPADAALRATLETLSTDEVYARLKAIDPESAARIGATDRYRLIRALEIITQSGKTPSEHRRDEPLREMLPIPLFVVDRDKAELETRMRARVRAMMNAGLVAETKAIAQKHPESRVLTSVGYRQALEGLERGDSEDAMIESIVIANRQLAKAQRTWFRGKHPGAEWFLLEQDRAKLFERMRRVFGC